MKDIKAFIRGNWNVQSEFQVTRFGETYKITFKARFDYEIARKRHWTWFGQSVMLVLQWDNNVEPLEDVYNTLLIWIVFPNLSQPY